MNISYRNQNKPDIKRADIALIRLDENEILNLALPAMNDQNLGAVVLQSNNIYLLRPQDHTY